MEIVRDIDDIIEEVEFTDKKIDSVLRQLKHARENDFSAGMIKEIEKNLERISGFKTALLWMIG